MRGSGIYKCQWPGCNYDAPSVIKRGIFMDFMYLCPPHAAIFKGIDNEAAAAIGNVRQEIR